MPLYCTLEVWNKNKSFPLQHAFVSLDYSNEKKKLVRKIGTKKCVQCFNALNHVVLRPLVMICGRIWKDMRFCFKIQESGSVVKWASPVGIWKIRMPEMQRNWVSDSWWWRINKDCWKMAEIHSWYYVSKSNCFLPLTWEFDSVNSRELIYLAQKISKQGRIHAVMWHGSCSLVSTKFTAKENKKNEHKIFAVW